MKSQSMLMPNLRNFPDPSYHASVMIHELDSMLSQEGICQTGRQPLRQITVNTHKNMNNIETQS